MSAKTAANAVKHGLSSMQHMPRGREHELLPIEQALIASRRPETPEQQEIIHELAFFTWQRGEHERILLEESEHLCEKAGELFETKAQQAYDELLEKWLADPVRYSLAMSQCMHGSLHFMNIWRMMDSNCEDGTEASLEMALAAIRTEGMLSSPLWIHGDGVWMMRRILVTRPRPDEFLKEWVKREGLNYSVDSIRQYATLRHEELECDAAYEELCERSRERHEFWAERYKAMVKEHQAAKERFIEQYRATVMISDEFDAQMKRMHRYRAFTENRVKDCNRRLTNISAKLEREARQRDDREDRLQKRLIEMARLSPFEYERLLDLQQLHARKVESGTKTYHPENHEPIAQPVEPPKPDPEPAWSPTQEVIKVPRDWRKQKSVLTKIVPNLEAFSEWTDEEMNHCNEFIEYIAGLTGKDTEWKQRLMGCQIHEFSRRHVQKMKTA